MMCWGNLKTYLPQCNYVHFSSFKCQYLVKTMTGGNENRWNCSRKKKLMMDSIADTVALLIDI